MDRMLTELERREGPRFRERIPCRILVAGRAHAGSVTEFSAHGFFVETGADLTGTAGAILSFSTPEGRHFVLEAALPHQRGVSQSLAGLAPTGVGLRIVDPPAEYLGWVREHAGESPAAS